MGTLLNWEMKQTFSSKSFWIIGGALIVGVGLKFALKEKTV